MVPTASRERPAEMNLYVIFTLNTGEEGFNGVRSIKPDIYFALGCVWFTDPVLNRLVQFNVIRHYVETNLFPYYS